MARGDGGALASKWSKPKPYWTCPPTHAAAAAALAGTGATSVKIVAAESAVTAPVANGCDSGGGACRIDNIPEVLFKRSRAKWIFLRTPNSLTPRTTCKSDSVMVRRTSPSIAFSTKIGTAMFKWLSCNQRPTSSTVHVSGELTLLAMAAHRVSGSRSSRGHKRPKPDTDTDAHTHAQACKSTMPRCHRHESKTRHAHVDEWSQFGSQPYNVNYVMHLSRYALECLICCCSQLIG